MLERSEKRHIKETRAEIWLSGVRGRGLGTLGVELISTLHVSEASGHSSTQRLGNFTF